MKRLFILFAICLCAISCEQNNVIDTKVKIEKVIPDGVYIETLSWYWKNNDDRLCCIGCKDPNITFYILIENNIPYRYVEEKCGYCNTRLIYKVNSNITVDIKDRLWKGPGSYEYNIIKYTENNITLFETKQHSRERHGDLGDQWCREYIVYERVDDNGELFQKLKATKSYTLEEYRKWWKENGCDRCGYYID